MIFFLNFDLFKLNEEVVFEFLLCVVKLEDIIDYVWSDILEL